MNEFFSYLLNIILSIALLVLTFKLSKQPKEVIKLVKDETTINQLNKDYEDLEMMYFNESEKHESEIKRFKALKSSVVYKYIHQEKIIHDTLIECCQALQTADQIIVYSDSLNITLEKALNSCTGNLTDTKRQLQFNKAFNGEIYKHLIWKIYLKKK
jgi:hypothetical protein